MKDFVPASEFQAISRLVVGRAAHAVVLIDVAKRYARSK